MDPTPPWDQAFVVYAGPWAEARWLWNGDADLTGEDADGDGTTFDDVLAGVFLREAHEGRAARTAGSTSKGQHDDWVAYDQACRAADRGVHFVARAASNAFFSRDIVVTDGGNINQAQW